MPLIIEDLKRGSIVWRMPDSDPLQYHDQYIPRGTLMLVGEVKFGVVDLVRRDEQVFAIPAADLTGNFEQRELPVRESDRAAATTALHRAFRQPLEGEPIEPQPRMLVQRTGLPFYAMHEHYAPHGVPLKLADVLPEGHIFYVDQDTYEERTIPSQYFTSAYFTVLAQHVPVAEELKVWMASLRLNFPYREIVREDLEKQMSQFGINPPEEIMSWWLRYLNDHNVDLGRLLRRLSRLMNIFAESPSERSDTLAELRRSNLEELCEGLAAEPHEGWRRQLIYIGLVLQNRNQFAPEAVEAATIGLEQYRP